jgi:hypothetical protein
MITYTSGTYWLDRLAEAVANASAAPSQRSRQAYLTLAGHYRAMHEFAVGERVSPAAIVVGHCDSEIGRPELAQVA